MKENREERIASIVLIIFSAAYLVGAFLIPMPALKQQLGPGGFPIAIGFAMLILACVYAWQQFRGGDDGEGVGGGDREAGGDHRRGGEDREEGGPEDDGFHPGLDGVLCLLF